ncbi:MAG: class I SAM-dependent methyltransferase [Desulfobacterales bacterium]|nr:class I SAM-dependent methyltransferase [Desulfobacterales bacterium]
MPIVCPLCSSNRTEITEIISAPELISAYKAYLNIDVRQEISVSSRISFAGCKGCGLSFFSPAPTGSGVFYRQLQKYEWYYLDEKEEYDFARKFLKPTDKVLEVGCGKGAFALKVETGDYVGLELSMEAASAGGENGATILTETIEKHAEKHPKEYDVVCFFQVLEHIVNLHGFIESAITCLKPGGLLICSVPSADSFLTEVENGILNMPPHHLTWWSDDTLKKMGDVFGIQLIHLHHELLADIHLEWYASTVASGALKRLFGLKRRLLDKTFGNRIIGIVARGLGKFYSKGLESFNLRPHGHSVTVVFKRKQ